MRKFTWVSVTCFYVSFFKNIFTYMCIFYMLSLCTYNIIYLRYDTEIALLQKNA